MVSEHAFIALARIGNGFTRVYIPRTQDASSSMPTAYSKFKVVFAGLEKEMYATMRHAHRSSIAKRNDEYDYGVLCDFDVLPCSMHQQRCR